MNKIVGGFMKLQGGRFSEVHLSHRCPLATRVVLVLLLATVSLAAGCGNTNAEPAIPTPEVEIASVIQNDVPIFSEWVATLDGYISAQTLLGQNPGAILRGLSLTEQHQPPEVPPDLRSELLERRPDIREAEEQLIAANAEIGASLTHALYRRRGLLGSAD